MATQTVDKSSRSGVGKNSFNWFGNGSIYDISIYYFGDL